ncbi:MAG: hypothetical protein ACJAYE_002405 [Candidatus Azotimanducaceae bacterium]|jgi:hypothetical protein
MFDLGYSRFQQSRFISSFMTFRKITVISLLLAGTMFAQALSSVDHIHLHVVAEQECLICGSASADAALVATVHSAIVPIASKPAAPKVYQRHFSAVLDLRSRAPPLLLDV